MENNKNNEEGHLEHQDWKPVTIQGQPKTLNRITPKNPPIPSNAHVKKLEEATEAGRLKQLDIQARNLLITGRTAKGLKQDQVAQALSMPANLYKDIESGKMIPTQQQLNKINNFLRVNAKLN